MISPSEPRPVQTQFLVFTLFGEYVVERGGRIWTSSLLYLLGLLGISERAVRSTLSRMARKGWIVGERQGRRSRYHVTSRGYALLEEGQKRIFEPVISEWNGRWQLVLYTLPEKKRRKRHALRTRLSWLGFGQLASSTWISPHDRRGDLKVVVDDLDLEPHVDLFCGAYLGPESSKELVNRCWDMEGIESQYRAFIDKYQPEYQRFAALERESQDLDEEECFKRRFWLTYDFQSFPLQDPNLPTALLDPDWCGFAARRLFDNYRRLLSNHVKGFADEVISGDGKVQH